MAIKGFDWSHYQQEVDFVKAYAAGYRFAIGKASQAAAADPTFKARAAAARAAGFVVGGYHFFDPLVKPEDQLEFFLQQFERGLPYLFAGDFEQCYDAQGKDKWDQLDAELRSTVSQDFLDGLSITTRARAFLYGGPYFLNQYLASFPTGSYRVWLADYVSKIPTGWQNVTAIWQETSALQVDGIPGPVDGDVFQSGGQQELLAMAGTL